MEKSTKEKKGDRVRVFEIKMFFMFSMSILVVSVCVTYLVVTILSRTMKREVSGLVAANTSQVELNINSYLENIEKTVALMYSDKMYYEYDATDPGLDEYQKIAIENSIVDRIIDIGTMDNFSDFCITYRNNYTIGWLSDTTEEMFKEKSMYEYMSEYISDSNRGDGWICGVFSNYERMYYAKRLNENAILVSSFYTRELSDVFEFSEELEGIIVRLVDENNHILYSSGKDENGLGLADDIQKIIEGKSRFTKIDDNYLVDVNTCNNEWRVVCVIPTDVILEQNDNIIKCTFLVAFIVAAVFTMFGTIVIRRASKPVDTMVTSLKIGATIDSLAKVHNKISFQETVKRNVEIYSGDKTIVFIMFDVDNFKAVNDTLGHKHGDDVIRKMGALLNRCFEDSFFIGRLGGDEFAMYADYQLLYSEKEVRKAKKEMEIFCEVFLEEFDREHRECNLSISIGMYVAKRTKAEKLTFDEIYQKTDEALYESKKSGKNKCTVIEKEA